MKEILCLMILAVRGVSNKNIKSTSHIFRSSHESDMNLKASLLVEGRCLLESVVPLFSGVTLVFSKDFLFSPSNHNCLLF